MRRPRLSPSAAAYAGFAAFGALWGAWGAALPAVREQAGLTDGELGTALLFVGAGALPAMLLTGRAVDRWGQRVTAPAGARGLITAPAGARGLITAPAGARGLITAILLLALGGVGVAVALTGRGFLSLSVGLAVLGAASGAADVAINAAAGSAERACGRPVITRAHGVFSAGVVVASLGTGVLLGSGFAVAVPFVLVAVMSGAAACVVLAAAHRSEPQPAGWHPRARRSWPSPPRLLLVIGGLGALAFAVENAHQSWSAIYLSDVLSAGPATAAVAPAVFAAVVAATRFTLGALDTVHHTPVLLGGAATAAAGSAVLATAGSVWIALVGLGLAAAGTAVLYPTLLSLVTAQIDEAARGAATSVVATTAYLGFLAGPVFVGSWAAAVGLPGAMLAVGALAAGLAVLVWPAVHLVVGGDQPWARSAKRL